MLELIKAAAPYVAALAGLLGGIYAAVKSNSNQLTAAYFNRMTAAYEQHWNAFVEFAYNPNDENRNAYTASVYNAVLYSAEDAAKGIQVLYRKAIEYTRSGQYDMRQLDEWSGTLEEILHEDVLRFQKRARR